MDTQKIITPNEINEMMQQYGCNYFCVENPNTKKIIRTYGKKQDKDNCIADIAQTISNLPNIAYFPITLKKSHSKESEEFKAKLTHQKTALSAGSGVVNNYSPFEEARTIGKALEDGNLIASLKSEILYLKDKIDALNKENAELMEEEETLADEKPNAMIGFFKDVMPQFMPLAEKYFEIADKKLALEAMKINNQPKLSQQPKHPFRPLPDVNDRAMVEKYFQFLEKIPEHIFNQEVKFLEKNAAGLHAVVIEKFTEEIPQENDKE